MELYFNRDSWKDRDRHGFNVYGEDLVGVTRLGYNVYEDRDQNLADKIKRAILMPAYRVYYLFHYFTRFGQKISRSIRSAFEFIILLLYGVGFGICKGAKAIARGTVDVFYFFRCLVEAFWYYTFPIRMVLKVILGVAVFMATLWLLGAAGALLG